MKEFKIPFRYAVLSIKNEMKSVNAYLLIIIIFLIIEYCFMGVSDYLRINMDYMNVFELYTFFLSNRTSQIIYIIGIMFLSCGILFYSNGASYYLIRASRKKWIWGQSIYLVGIVVFFNMFIFLSLCISTGGNITFSNEWSNASVLASQFSVLNIGIKPIISISYKLLQISPVFAGIITFILSTLIGVVTGLIMICSNVGNKNVFGIAGILVLWFFDILIENESIFFKIEKFSPFGISRISTVLELGTEPMIIYSIIYLCIIIAIEIYILMNLVEKIDFVKLE